MRRYVLPLLLLLQLVSLARCGGCSSENGSDWFAVRDAPDEGQVLGLVYDVETEAPLAGVKVQVGEHEVTTDEAGHFEITVAAGLTQVVVAPRTYLRWQQQMGVGETATELLIGLMHRAPTVSIDATQQTVSAQGYTLEVPENAFPAGVDLSGTWIQGRALAAISDRSLIAGADGKPLVLYAALDIAATAQPQRDLLLSFAAGAADQLVAYSVDQTGRFSGAASAVTISEGQAQTNLAHFSQARIYASCPRCAAVVKKIRGSVTVVTAAGGERTLTVGDIVNIGESIKTGDKSLVVLETVGSVAARRTMTIGASSEVRVQPCHEDQSSGFDKLLQGCLRWTREKYPSPEGGAEPQEAPASITTRGSVIGLRGTDVSVCDDPAGMETVEVLDGTVDLNTPTQELTVEASNIAERQSAGEVMNPDSLETACACPTTECKEDQCKAGYITHCQRDQDGCYAQAEVEACPSHKCKSETACDDSCTDAENPCLVEGAATCEAGTIYRCEKDARGCLVLVQKEQCKLGKCLDSRVCMACEDDCLYAGRSTCTDGKLKVCEADVPVQAEDPWSINAATNQTIQEPDGPGWDYCHKWSEELPCPSGSCNFIGNTCSDCSSACPAKSTESCRSSSVWQATTQTGCASEYGMCEVSTKVCFCSGGCTAQGTEQASCEGDTNGCSAPAPAADGGPSDGGMNATDGSGGDGGGDCVTEYYDNGNIKWYNCYWPGTKILKYSVEYWPTPAGQKNFEGFYDEQGELNGVGTHWYQNGYKDEVIDAWVHGSREGTRTKWSDDGMPLFQQTYVNDTIDGKVVVCNGTDTVTDYLYYENGNQVTGPPPAPNTPCPIPAQ